MFSTSTSFKFSKKRNQYENSTQTFQIKVGPALTYRAYSYNEVIGLRFKSKGKEYYLINQYRFSNTTSKHQNMIGYFVRNKNLKNVIHLSMGTMNQGLSFEGLERSSYNLEAVELFFPSKLKTFKKEVIVKEIEDKKFRNDQAKRNKIMAFKYKSKEGFLKAIKEAKIQWDLKTHNPDHALKLIDMGFSWEEVQKNWLHDNFNIDFNDWINFKIKNIDAIKYVVEGNSDYYNFISWTNGKKHGLEKEMKKHFKKPGPRYYHNIGLDFDFIDDKDLIQINKDQGPYNEITDYLTKKKLGDLINE